MPGAVAVHTYEPARTSGARIVMPGAVAKSWGHSSVGMLTTPCKPVHVKVTVSPTATGSVGGSNVPLGGTCER